MGWIGIIGSIITISVFTLILLFATSTIRDLLQAPKDSSFDLNTLNRQTRANPDSELIEAERYLRNVSETARLTSEDDMIGNGNGIFILLLIIVYGILALRLWASICLLNGTNRVSSLIHLFRT